MKAVDSIQKGFIPRCCVTAIAGDGRSSDLFGGAIRSAGGYHLSQRPIKQIHAVMGSQISNRSVFDVNCLACGACGGYDQDQSQDSGQGGGAGVLHVDDRNNTVIRIVPYPLKLGIQLKNCCESTHKPCPISVSHYVDLSEALGVPEIVGKTQRPRMGQRRSGSSRPLRWLPTLTASPPHYIPIFRVELIDNSQSCIALLPFSQLCCWPQRSMRRPTRRPKPVSEPND